MAHDLGGSGAPLVVCHATGFHGRAYGPLATGLVARFRVWAIDFRGHGAATAPVDGNFAWAGMRDDLLAVVDALAAYVRDGFVDDGDDGEGGVRLACAPLTEALTFEAEGSLSVTEITGVAMPVVVAAGRSEPPPNPAQYAPHVAAALPRGTLVEHEHLGHFGPLQDPDRIALDVCARL